MNSEKEKPDLLKRLRQQAYDKSASGLDNALYLEAADALSQALSRVRELEAACADLASPEFMDKYDALQERVARYETALTSIMHARGNPNSPVTNMGRSLMREIAAAALDASLSAKEGGERA